MSKEITTINEAAVVSPATMMQMAFDAGTDDLDKVERMIDLQAKHDAIQAKKAYTQAMAQFKKNPPEILKDVHVEFGTSAGKTSYNHASLGNVTKAINASLSKYGFSSSWATTQPENNIEVTCTITHKLGHSESTSLKSAPDTTGKKNAIQAIASTVTYLERYTLLALTGLATHGQDDDGRGAHEEPEYVKEKEQSNIRDLLTSLDCDEQTFLGWLGCDSIDTIDKVSYKRAIVNLKARIEAEQQNDNS